MQSRRLGALGSLLQEEEDEDEEEEEEDEEEEEEEDEVEDEEEVTATLPLCFQTACCESLPFMSCTCALADVWLAFVASVYEWSL